MLHHITNVYNHCIVMSLYLPPPSAGQMEIYIRLDNQSDPLLQAMLELNMLKMSFFFPFINKSFRVDFPLRSYL